MIELLSEEIMEESVVADYRENPSGIPQLLMLLGLTTRMEMLKSGDYIINEQILIERKTKDDFVVSLMQNRLFGQCANLIKAPYRPLLLIEENPYKTNHEISRQAIQGALLSIALSWQLPMVFSSGITDSARLIAMAARQNMSSAYLGQRKGFKPKAISRARLSFLQGLPQIGPRLALELYNHFGSVEKVLLANEKELMKIPGIGRKKAALIRAFIVCVKEDT